MVVHVKQCFIFKKMLTLTVHTATVLQVSVLKGQSSGNTDTFCEQS